MQVLEREGLLNYLGALFAKYPKEYQEMYKLIRSVIRGGRWDIKAIPIEWLKEYEIKNGQEVRLQSAIEEWEKENTPSTCRAV